MAINDTLIRAAKPREKDWKLADEKGLYLLVTAKGSKLWRVKFRINGKEKKLSLGAYPEISLKEARRLRDEARTTLAEGADPARRKREEKVAAKLGAENSFAAIAEEYLDKRKKEGLAEATLTKSRWFLDHLRPSIGKLPIAEITPHEILLALRKVENAGKRETANRIRSFASRVFRYAIATARANADPAHALRGALAAPIVKHYAAITDAAELGQLLRSIDTYSGEPATLVALQLTPHVFQRPGEVRQMRWQELDLERAVWTIPESRMKQRRGDHAVPLSRQAVELIQRMQGLSSHSVYVFPSVRSKDRPMSENTITGALRRLGYGGSEMTAHGFRTTASSLLNESGKWNPDAIERALSHADKNAIRGTYNRSPYWKERVAMAQWWSDHLEALRSGATIRPFDRSGAA
ncbi:tyrosine-type recombinase/integrase [Altericroceibacterium endophyticum]|uniref:Tyrosine-type recombinase/integrase n=1 Tax=Altericroceibacterium endophyticum TaxID=1808508 RepID=A0A6I4T234_9SPHN|nr:integrase arm-type DNA-binding domain-containing protein [Altericroceibacterium endophyticum]MXO65304.1 tyrosine-type recombinase/integrase [Altericroceibacterium endophyticum]